MAEYTFGPALRSLWFLFFGLALGPAVLIFERDPQGNPLMWLGLGFLSLGLILHRLSLKYTLTDKKIVARSWWGRGPVETVSLDRLGEVRVRAGLAGVAHLEVLSLAPTHKIDVKVRKYKELAGSGSCQEPYLVDS